MSTPQKPRRPDARSPFVFDVRELGRRPGAMQQFDRDLPATKLLGSTPAAATAPAKAAPQAATLDGLYTAEGADLLLDLRLESVVEGVLATGRVSGSVIGECVRCLDPVEAEVDADFQELFYYDGTDLSAEEAQEALYVVDELLSVESLVHDAVKLELPLQPLCGPDCAGLCSECGARLADEPDHRHESVDPRWAALQSLDLGGVEDPADR